MLQKKGFSALLLGGLVQACATAPAPSSVAVATPVPSSPQQSATGVGADPNETICREVAGTGWRLGNRRECKTRAQWEAADAKGEP